MNAKTPFPRDVIEEHRLGNETPYLRGVFEWADVLEDENRRLKARLARIGSGLRFTFGVLLVIWYPLLGFVNRSLAETLRWYVFIAPRGWLALLLLVLMYVAVGLFVISIVLAIAYARGLRNTKWGGLLERNWQSSKDTARRSWNKIFDSKWGFFLFAVFILWGMLVLGLFPHSED